MPVAHGEIPAQVPPLAKFVVPVLVADVDVVFEV